VGSFIHLRESGQGKGLNGGIPGVREERGPSTKTSKGSGVTILFKSLSLIPGKENRKKNE